MTDRQIDRAVAAYARSRPRLEVVTSTFVELLTRMLDDAGFNYLSVTGRTKTVASFAAKAHRERDGRAVHPGGEGRGLCSSAKDAAETRAQHVGLQDPQ